MEIEVSAALTEEISSDTHWIGGWVNARAGLDCVFPFLGNEIHPFSP
jgi:hypothetical protein